MSGGMDTVMEGVDGVIDVGADGFVFTTDMDFRAQVASLTGSGLSLGLSLFICAASAWIYTTPSARHHLDRVSFRLLLWSMMIEVVYNAAYIYLFSDPAGRMDDAETCSAGVYFLVGSMGTANWLCTCIGLNLMLAICMGINPVKARLERWYVAGSLILGFGVAIVPAALGDFGRDEVYQACYFTAQEDDDRIKDFVLDLYLWQTLSCLIAAGSVAAVLITLLRQSRATERALFRANDLNITSQELRQITTASHISENSSHDGSKAPWFVRWIPARIIRLIPGIRRLRDNDKASQMHRLEDKFITIALKISLYPLALLLINSFITAEDLIYTLRGGVRDQGDYVVYCIYYFLYGGRGIFFALLGIFVDPCLRKGLPAAYHARFKSQSHRNILPIVAITAPDGDDKTELGASVVERLGRTEGGDRDGDELGPESMTDFLSSSSVEPSRMSTGLAESRGFSGSGDTTLCSNATKRSGGSGSWRGLKWWSRKDGHRHPQRQDKGMLSVVHRRDPSQTSVEEMAIESFGIDNAERGDIGLGSGLEDMSGDIGAGLHCEKEAMNEKETPGGNQGEDGREISVSLNSAPHTGIIPTPARPTLIVTIDPSPRRSTEPPNNPHPLPPVSPTSIHSPQAPIPTPASPTFSTHSNSRSNWLEPLVSAVLAPPGSPLGPRRSSDPDLGAAYRRKRELRAAAEKLYVDAQAQL